MNRKIKIKEEAIFWIMCEKDGFSKDEKERFSLWLLEDEEHQKTFNRMKLIHSLSNNISNDNRNKLLENTHKTISKRKLFKKSRISFTIAASLIFACFFSIKVYENSFKIHFSKEFKTELNAFLETELPDGSKIHLDAKTDIEVEFYENKRFVNLNEGRAIFNVIKDDKRPFIIRNKDINIEVVGTKFEVLHKENSTTVRVEEGKVKTYYSKYFIDKQNKKLLEKEDSITYLAKNGEIIEHKKIDINKIALWRKNIVSLDNSNIKDAVEEFLKYNDFSIDYSIYDEEKYFLTGEFSTMQFNIFLNKLKKIYPLNIEIKDKSIKISEKY
ncbi:siderophore-interacting protein [Aliarcobacter thereius]|uniref:FecR family protein n=1 Tax=Aliarcobacter thereius TaxID=544718 RepID=UPI0010FCE4C6|nr:FecR domain-containing protein [Aliarcobacter thereius]TLT08386.1 siderophore-interacting protein [Aliarcobacter thereius]